MKFNYQARTKEGQIQTGVVEAASREATLNLLQKYGLYVTLLEEISHAPFYARKLKIIERVSRKDIVLFSRQLSIMFKSEVPMVESLLTLAKQMKSSDFREKIVKLSDEVEGGTSFSKALSRYPKIFSNFYISVIKSGEASGKLSEVLEYLADHLEREYYLSSKIKGAVIYPALIVFVVFAVLFVMIFFVVPHLAQVLEGSGEELPFVIKFFTGLTAFLKTWALLLIFGFLGIVALFFRYLQTQEGKRLFDKFLLKLPLLKDVLIKIYTTRFAENFSTLIAGGIPISQCLEITSEIVGNTTYQDVILKTRDEVRNGESISYVLQDYTDIFPPVFVQMVMVGEKTGTLDKTLMSIVNFYQNEVDRAIDNFLSILEPVLIMFLGVVVAGLMMSVLMPLYQMMTL